jgi:hypothetical protein
MAHIDHFIGGTGVGIADVCIAASEHMVGDEGVAPADLLEAGWALLTDPQTLETSHLVDRVGPMAHVVYALMVLASTSTTSMESMREGMSLMVEGG